MTHTYERFCYRIRDGKEFRATCTIDGVDVAVALNGYRAGNRSDFLELLNRWNRQGCGNVASGYLYTYYAT